MLGTASPLPMRAEQHTRPKREREGEGRPVAGDRVDPQPPTVGRDEALTDEQSETGALLVLAAVSARRVKRPKMCCRCSAVSPGPWSLTATLASASPASTRTTTSPPGAYFSALSSKFVKTCSRRSPIPLTDDRYVRYVEANDAVAGDERRLGGAVHGRASPDRPEPGATPAVRPPAASSPTCRRRAVPSARLR